ncbi:head-tail adaptor protein [Neolewinella antarctica]|uniref:Head-tail adaptor n=1 Tax=Neolewinella antarctica TaxID=442734 RepID=A0ABX0X7J5_9BACT|nr:head-tail adaptor protein [Neolewinella antarctica]NJC24797.1 head-tail adaptor [Neolewinella antarctica]
MADLIGQMRSRITIQRPTTARGQVGGSTKTWNDLETGVYAAPEFRSVGSDEKQKGDRVYTRATLLLTIRRENRELSTTDRVVFDRRVYDILSVSPTGDRLELLKLECLAIGEQTHE